MNEHTEDISDEDLANDRWENEGGHTECETGTVRLARFAHCRRSPH
jgi:hypothetical protein